jgi:hypothetical protein
MTHLIQRRIMKYLKGLTIGTAAWEEDFDFHISKLMRIVATIG